MYLQKLLGLESSVQFSGPEKCLWYIHVMDDYYTKVILDTELVIYEAGCEI